MGGQSTLSMMSTLVHRWGRRDTESVRPVSTRLRGNEPIGWVDTYLPEGASWCFDGAEQIENVRQPGNRRAQVARPHLLHLDGTASIWSSCNTGCSLAEVNAWVISSRAGSSSPIACFISCLMRAVIPVSIT